VPTACRQALDTRASTKTSDRRRKILGAVRLISKLESRAIGRVFVRTPFPMQMNMIPTPLSIATFALSILGATFAVAQVNPDDFTEEPDKTMAASHSSFVKGDTAKASQQIRKAATYVKNESREVAASAKDGVEEAAASLDKLGREVKNGTVKSGDELRQTFARVDHALAVGWHKTAEEAKNSGKDADAALRKAGAALDGAAKWSGTKLKQGAQASIRTLQKAGKKTGEAIKAGAKEVEGWFNDLGNGIKDVGRKL
jgi:hypothetical protein